MIIIILCISMILTIKLLLSLSLIGNAVMHANSWFLFTETDDAGSLERVSQWMIMLFEEFSSFF